MWFLVSRQSSTFQRIRNHVASSTCQFPNMNYQLAPYQPLISRRIEFAPQQLPAAPMISRRMEFGMRKLKIRLHEKIPDLSRAESFLPLPVRSPSLPPTRSRSQTPAEGLHTSIPTASRFATKYRSQHKTPPTTSTRISAKSPKPTGIRFNLEDEDMDSQNGSDPGGDPGEEDSGDKIPKPPGEPGRPKSGGYKLESILG